jgi:hypothetical protein
VGSFGKTIAAALACAAVLAASATAAVATSPSQYRTTLNSMCRASTVKIKALEREMNQAQQAQDAHALGIALGKVIGITLIQDARIEATPIPAQLRSKMVPTVGLLKKADVVMRKIVQDAAAGRGQAMLAGLTTVQRMTGPINAHLDAAGLRDCGSNQ